MWAVKNTIPIKAKFIARTSIAKLILRSETRIKPKVIMARQKSERLNRGVIVGYGVHDDNCEVRSSQMGVKNH